MNCNQDSILCTCVPQSILAGLLVGMLLVAKSAVCADDSVFARIADFRPPVTVHRVQVRSPYAGLQLSKGDTVVVAQGGMTTIIFPDGIVQTFDGPTVITSASDRKGRQGFIGKLTSALANVIFPGKEAPERVRLAVRGLTVQDIPTAAMPVLISPPRKTLLMDGPARFSWQPLSGASSYTIILSDQKHVLWELKTQNSSAEIPLEGNLFVKGESYYWTVETEIGRTMLQSEQATFRIIDSLSRLEVIRAIEELDELGIEPRLTQLLRISIYQDYSLLEEEYQEIESLLERWPDDFNGLLLKARLMEAMYLFEEAAHCYRIALGQ